MVQGLEFGIGFGQGVDGCLPARTQVAHGFAEIDFVTDEEDRSCAVFVGVRDLATKRRILRRLAAVEGTVGIFLLGLVAQDDDGLVLDVDAGIVVIALALGRDAVADKHERHVEFSRAADGQRREFLAEGQFDRFVRFAIGGGSEEFQLVFLSRVGSGGNGEPLKGRIFEQPGFQTEIGKSLGNVVGCQIQALGVDPPPFELVGSEEFGHRGEPLVGVGHGRGRFGGRTAATRDGEQGGQGQNGSQTQKTISDASVHNGATPGERSSHVSILGCRSMPVKQRCVRDWPPGAEKGPIVELGGPARPAGGKRGGNLPLTRPTEADILCPASATGAQPWAPRASGKRARMPVGRERNEAIPYLIAAFHG